MDASAARQIERYREHALGVLLFLLVQDYEARFLHAYRQRGFDDVLRSHGAVFRYLDSRGAPISRIAERAGITKQTVGRFVRELQALGYLTVMPDENDRRVRRVAFSERGERLVTASADIVVEIRRAYEAAIGQQPFREFAGALERAARALDIRFAFLGEAGERDRRRFYHFGRLMVEVAEDFERRLLSQLPAADAQQVSRPMLTLFCYLQEPGQTISELAQRLPVTVQAVSLTVRQLVDRGYLATRDCGDDNRAKRIAITAEGARLLASLNEALTAVRGDYRRLLGNGCLSVLEKRLRELVNTLSGGAPITLAQLPGTQRD